MNSYNTPKEIRDYLVPLGFHEYSPTRFDSSGVCICFQKRYDDERGKKYFLNAKVYDFTFTDKVRENYHISFSCQLYQKGTHDALNIEFIDWNIDQIEKFVDNLFDTGMLEHYETWEEL